MAEVWTLDEKMGRTYTSREQANTLAARDYKQPQAVIVFRDDVTIKIDEDDLAFTLGARDFKGVQCVAQWGENGLLRRERSVATGEVERQSRST